MGWYCLYILLMGINGISEAFAHASADKRQLKFFNYIMIGQSAVFLTAAVALITKFETVGMIFASCINMLIRILTSFWWINRFYSSSSGEASAIKLRDWLPHHFVCGTLLISFAVTYASSRFFCANSECALMNGFQLIPQALHIGVGGALGLISLAVTYAFEKELLFALIRRSK